MQPLWLHNPAISPIGRREIRCGAGCLPYLCYPRRDHRLEFSDTYRAADHRAHVYLTDEELIFGVDAHRRYGSYILIEPTPRDRKNVNRCYPNVRWEQVVSRLQRACSHAIVQCDHPDAHRLPGVPAIPSPDIRRAAALIQRASLVVCLEGGLAFLAAALGTPAVVLWGGCVSAATLAYPEHVNLVFADARTPCGHLRACDHCTAAWAWTTPEMVADAVFRAVNQQVPAGVVHGAA